MTSKLQVTIPKRIAMAYAITPGSEVEFQEAGEVIRLVPIKETEASPTDELEHRLSVFDGATERQAARNARSGMGVGNDSETDRGWTREELYDRAIPH